MMASVSARTFGRKSGPYNAGGHPTALPPPWLCTAATVLLLTFIVHLNNDLIFIKIYLVNI